MKECVSAIRKSVRRGTYEIVVVDNRSTDGVQQWLRDQLDIRLIENGRNVGYPTGMNIAYRACRKENDIFMLNNDAVLTPNAYFWLRMALYAGREVGAVGPMSNEASGQTISPVPATMEETFLLAKGINLPSENPCEEALSLTGFAVLIGAEAAKSVSMEKDIMDDRYSPAYFEDDDLSVRILYAGYRNRIVHNALVYHKGGSGFPEGNVKEEEEKVPAQAKMELLQKSRKQFVDKWGFDIWAYKGVWTDFADVIDKEQNAPIRILELDWSQFVLPAIPFSGKRLRGNRPEPAGSRAGEESRGSSVRRLRNLCLSLEKTFFRLYFCSGCARTGGGQSCFYRETRELFKGRRISCDPLRAFARRNHTEPSGKGRICQNGKSR